MNQRKFLVIQYKIGIIIFLLFLAFVIQTGAANKREIPSNKIVSWAKTLGYLGDDYIFSIAPTDDGNIIVAGELAFSGRFNAWLAKVSSEGKIVWQNTYRSGNFKSAIPVFGGGYIAAGDGPKNSMVKVDKNGKIIWQKSYSDSRENQDFYANSVTFLFRTNDKNYIGAGWSKFFDSNFWLMKFNENGIPLWSQGFKTDPYNPWSGQLKGMTQNSKGEFVLVGNTVRIRNEGEGALVIKVDQNGKILWQKSYGRTEEDEEAITVVPVDAGGYFVAGFTVIRPPVPQKFPPEPLLTPIISKGWLMKIDENGNVVWRKLIYIPDKGISILAIRPLSSGDFIAIGSLETLGSVKVQPRSNVLLFHFSPSGDIVWQKAFGGMEENLGQSVFELPDGSIMVSAWTTSFGRYRDGWLLRLGLGGEITFNKKLGVKVSSPALAIDTIDAPVQNMGFLEESGSFHAVDITETKVITTKVKLKQQAP